MSATYGDRRLPERFWTKVSVNAETGCWEWTASLFRKGYSQWAGPHAATGHRNAYIALVGPVSDDLVLDHLCRVKHCVNPAHLDPVPQRINILRGDLPATNIARSNRDTCRKGRHPWVEENIFHNKTTGKPQCRPCLEASYKRAAERRKARRRATQEQAYAAAG